MSNLHASISASAPGTLENPRPAYILSPYSGTEHERKDRFQAAAAFCAWLHTNALGGKYYIPFSPIVHNHALAEGRALPTDIDYWWPHNRGMLNRLGLAIILCAPGFRESRGMSKEFAFIEQSRNISYVPVYPTMLLREPYVIPDVAQWETLDTELWQRTPGQVLNPLTQNACKPT